MIDGSEALSRGAKIAGSIPGWGKSSINSAKTGLFLNNEGHGSKKREIGFVFHMLCQIYSGALSHTGTRLLEICTFLQFQLCSRQLN